MKSFPWRTRARQYIWPWVNWLQIFKASGVRWPKSVTAISICSRQFQFVPGNFNFTHGNFNLFTAILICSQKISIYSWQFQFTPGNFNLFRAISIWSRQFQFIHGKFNFLTANNAHGIFLFAHQVKTQNQSEKWKSKIENRLTNTYAVDSE